MSDNITEFRNRVIEPIACLIGQPPCGCLARWQWHYLTAEDILPASVTVTGVAPCNQHANDAVYQATLAAAVRQRLEDFRDRAWPLGDLIDDRD